MTQCKKAKEQVEFGNLDVDGDVMVAHDVVQELPRQTTDLADITTTLYNLFQLEATVDGRLSLTSVGESSLSLLGESPSSMLSVVMHHITRLPSTCLTLALECQRPDARSCIWKNWAPCSGVSRAPSFYQSNCKLHVARFSLGSLAVEALDSHVCIQEYAGRYRDTGC